MIYGSESTSLHFITLIKRQNGNKLLSSLTLTQKTQAYTLSDVLGGTETGMSAIDFSMIFSFPGEC